VKSSDLVATASRLVGGRGKPRQSDLKRAISTLYYAMFHELARACADHLAGTNSTLRSNGAWRQVYRSLAHIQVVSQCEKSHFKNGNFPQVIKDFAFDFAEMQKKRHSADYDPFYKTTKSSVEADIALAVNSIKQYQSASFKDRKAFSIYVLLKPKG
jgi:uncharacterized protein (UPF0332 family)